MNGLTTNGVTSGRSVTVVVAAEVTGGVSAGVLTRPEIGADDIGDLIADAHAVARAAAPAEDAAAFIAGEAAGDWEKPAEQTGPQVLAEVSRGLGQVFAACEADGMEWFGTPRTVRTATWAERGHPASARSLGRSVNGKSHHRSRSGWPHPGTFAT
jgi:hypothetical protein